MKRLALFFVLVAASATVVAPAAQAIGVYAAYWNPKNSSKDGFGAGLRFDSSFTPIISMDTRVSYIGFSDADFSVAPIEATAKVKLGTLYAGLGLGYYYFSGDNDIKNDWGWYALAGLNILPRPLGLWGEFKWQFLEPENGGDLESYVFHVGVTFGR